MNTNPESPQAPQNEQNKNMTDQQSLQASPTEQDKLVVGPHNSKIKDTMTSDKDTQGGNWVCHPRRMLKRRFHKRLGDGSRVFRAHLDHWDSAPSSPSTISIAEAARFKLPEDLGEKHWCVSFGRTPVGIYPVNVPNAVTYQPEPQTNIYQYKPWEPKPQIFRLQPIRNNYQPKRSASLHQFKPRVNTYQPRRRVNCHPSNNPNRVSAPPTYLSELANSINDMRNANARKSPPKGRFDGPDDESEEDRGMALEAVRQKTITSVEWRHAVAVSSHPSIHFARKFDYSKFTHLHTYECEKSLSSSPVRAAMLFKKPSVSRTQSATTLFSIHCSSSDNISMLHHGHHIAQPLLGYMCPQVGHEVCEQALFPPGIAYQWDVN